MKLSNKKVIIFGSVFTMLLLVGIICMFDSKLKDVSIKESLVREKIQELLPINKTDTILGLSKLEVTITAIEVNFEEDLVKLTATGSVMLSATGILEETKSLINGMFKKKEPVKETSPKKINFTLFFSGLPDYDNGQNSIYLTIQDMKVTELTLEGLDIFVDSKGIVAGAVVKVAKLYLDRYPLYKLSNDFKGAMVRATVKGLEFQSEEVIVHFSLWGLIGKMVWFFFIAVLVFLGMVVFVIVVACNPGMFENILKDLI